MQNRFFPNLPEKNAELAKAKQVQVTSAQARVAQSAVVSFDDSTYLGLSAAKLAADKPAEQMVSVSSAPGCIR